MEWRREDVVGSGREKLVKVWDKMVSGSFTASYAVHRQTGEAGRYSLTARNSLAQSGSQSGEVPLNCLARRRKDGGGDSQLDSRELW